VVYGKLTPRERQMVSDPLTGSPAGCIEVLEQKFYRSLYSRVEVI